MGDYSMVYYHNFVYFYVHLEYLNISYSLN